VKGRVLKINQVKEYVLKYDQLECIRKAVYRFSQLTRSFDRFFIGGFAVISDKSFFHAPSLSLSELKEIGAFASCVFIPPFVDKSSGA